MVNKREEAQIVPGSETISPKKHKKKKKKKKKDEQMDNNVTGVLLEVNPSSPLLFLDDGEDFVVPDEQETGVAMGASEDGEGREQGVAAKKHKAKRKKREAEGDVEQLEDVDLSVLSGGLEPTPKKNKKKHRDGVENVDLEVNGEVVEEEEIKKKKKKKKRHPSVAAKAELGNGGYLDTLSETLVFKEDPELEGETQVWVDPREMPEDQWQRRTELEQAGAVVSCNIVSSEKKKKKRKKKEQQDAGNEDQGMKNMKETRKNQQTMIELCWESGKKKRKKQQQQEEEEEQPNAGSADQQTAMGFCVESGKKKKKRKTKEHQEAEEEQQKAGSADQQTAMDFGGESGKKKKKKMKERQLQKEEEQELPNAGSAELQAGFDLFWESGVDSDVERKKVKVQEHNMERYIAELKEFIPNVEQRCHSDIIRMVVYDLDRFRQFKQQGIAIKRGRYSVQENDLLRRNVLDFLLLTGLDSPTKLFFPSRYPEEKAMIKNLKTKHKFHDQIAVDIPRPWHDIYSRGRKIFDSLHYKGRFSSKDLDMLKKLHTMYGNNWSKISEVMGRSAHSLQMRFSQIESSKGEWTETELTRLVKAIREYLVSQLDPEEAAKGQHATIPREKLYKKIPWTEVALKVKTRSWTKCRVKWMSVLKARMSFGQNLYKGLQSFQAKINLIEKLHALEVEDVSDVNWDDLTDTIGDVPPSYVQAKFYKLKVTQVPLWHTMSFADIVDHLYYKTLPVLKATVSRMVPCSDGPAVQNLDTYLLSDIFHEDFLADGTLNELPEDSLLGEDDGLPVKWSDPEFSV
ncbi:TTF1 factor, partial [Amia calva]|nr:TTF1 factor [Amia calva]